MRCVASVDTTVGTLDDIRAARIPKSAVSEGDEVEFVVVGGVVFPREEAVVELVVDLRLVHGEGRGVVDPDDFFSEGVGVVAGASARFEAGVAELGADGVLERGCVDATREAQKGAILWSDVELVGAVTADEEGDVLVGECGDVLRRHLHADDLGVAELAVVGEALEVVIADEVLAGPRGVSSRREAAGVARGRRRVLSA
mmetsp:Transcript_32754/g.104400  ORF Transcript_32754/g.104400 Transcript_32754/m.104400 type:complete len:200 (+) Transcript_32754:107-706(+)